MPTITAQDFTAASAALSRWNALVADLPSPKALSRCTADPKRIPKIETGLQQTCIQLCDAHDKDHAAVIASPDWRTRLVERLFNAARSNAWIQNQPRAYHTLVWLCEGTRKDMTNGAGLLLGKYDWYAERQAERIERGDEPEQPAATYPEWEAFKAAIEEASAALFEEWQSSGEDSMNRGPIPSFATASYLLSAMQVKGRRGKHVEIEAIPARIKRYYEVRDNIAEVLGVDPSDFGVSLLNGHRPAHHD